MLEFSEIYQYFVNFASEQYDEKVLLSSFHLNGHTLGFHSGRLKS